MSFFAKLFGTSHKIGGVTAWQNAGGRVKR